MKEFPKRFPAGCAINVSPDCWFYENRGSIDVVFSANAERIQRIPRELLEQYVKRAAYSRLKERNRQREKRRTDDRKATHRDT